MDQDEPTTAAPPADEQAKPSPSPRGRLSKLLIVAGVLLSLAPLARIWPHEHQVDFRIEDGASDVTRFDVDWMRLDGDVTGDVVSGSSRSFERGRAPQIMSVSVHLPNGSYVVDIRIEHADRVDAIQQRVTLGDADRISIPLRTDRMRP